MSKKLLPRGFYKRDTMVVAKSLLGKRLVRILNEEILEGIITETEAYFGPKDPASRAHHGLKDYNKSMWGKVGTLFIYNVHKYWMLNIVAHEIDKVGAVLIRSIEPIKGIHIMRNNRNSNDLLSLTKGPGRLTEALRISKSLNEIDVTFDNREIFLLGNQLNFTMESSHRIGVRQDLKKKLRFFIKGNTYVS